MLHRNPERDLPVLLRRVNDLCRLARAIEDRQVSVRDDDYLGCLSLWFFYKQTEHAKAVVVLVENNLYRGAGLIVRSMMEGLVQLVWAAQGPEKERRPLRWRCFSVVADWRKLKRLGELGNPIEAEERASIESRLVAFGDEFLTEEGRERREKGLPPRTRDYCSNWTGKPWSAIFKEVGGDTLRLAVYSGLSAWHHWDPQGFTEALSFNGEEKMYAVPSARAGAEALANAFQCLFQTFDLLNKHFDFGLDAQLAGLREGYLTALGHSDAH